MGSKNEYIPSVHDGHAVFRKMPKAPPDVSYIAQTMPPVSFKMHLIPGWMRNSIERPMDPVECEVVYVNRPHLWYMVEYKGTGFRECFKAI